MREMPIRNEADKLLSKVQLYGFALYDTLLFLDTHPDDCEALAYFQRMRDAFMEAHENYVKKVRPLTAFDVDTEQEWSWIEGPWPWEGGAC